MLLSVTKKSGSVEDTDMAIPVETGDDLLIECSGGCGKKILFFGTPLKDSEGILCLECMSAPLKHTPKGK